MKLLTTTTTAAVFLLLIGGLPACGADDPMGGDPDATPTSDEYVPFSSENMASQQARVALYEEIVALRKADGFDASACGDLDNPIAGTIAEVYTRNDETGGVLRDKVAGRKDDHTFNAGAEIGVVMDATISNAIADCTAGTIEAKYAGQLVDKTLQWFFYASVYHELVLGQADAGDKWDEAFGYYGLSLDGSDARGISKTATKRDDNFGLTLNETIFDLFIEGRDQLAAGQLDAMEDTVRAMDQNLLLVFAYSCAREFAELPGDDDPANKLAEGIAFFSALQAHMMNESPNDGAYILTELQNASFDDPMAIDAVGIVSRIESVFGIGVSR